MPKTRKRTMKEALAGEPKRALGASATPGAGLSIALAGALGGATERIQYGMLKRQSEARGVEKIQAKIRTRKVQAKDPDKFLRKALAERQRRAK